MRRRPPSGIMEERLRQIRTVPGQYRRCAGRRQRAEKREGNAMGFARILKDCAGKPSGYRECDGEVAYLPIA